MADRWEKYKKCDELRVAAPKSVQDAIEIKSIAEDGIFEVGRGGIYTKTFTFSDINYSTSSIDEQLTMLDAWARWLNSNNERFKITFNNKNRDMARLKNEVLFNHRMDVFDDLRDYFNEVIEEKIIAGRQGIEQELYITISCDSVTNYDDAKAYFNNLQTNMERDFQTIGSRLRPLNARERLKVIHDVYRFGREESFSFSFADFYDKAWDFKEAIMPTRMDFSLDDKWFKVDDTYLSAIYIKNYPGRLSDRFLTELFSLNVKMMASIDCSPISKEDVDKRLKELYMGVQKRIRKQNRQRVKEKDYESEISYPVQLDQQDIKEVIDDVNNKDQHVFWTNCIILVMADSLEKLKEDVDNVIRRAQGSSVVIDYLYSMQKEALNTVLPIGIKQVDVGRPMETKSLAALFPFNVQELMVSGGLWYGANKESKNLCIGNRKKLMNNNGLIFGVTGSGKSSAAKLEIMQNYLKTDDDIIVIDPKGDFGKVVNACNGAEIYLGAGAENYFNPLDYFGSNRVDIAAEKSEVVLAILEACKKKPLSPEEVAIITRCLKYVYKDTMLNIEQHEEKTLRDLYEEFGHIAYDSSQNITTRDTAEHLKLYLEPFVDGTLNMFSQPTNVDVRNRLIVFNMSQLGKALWDVGMLVMLEHITERILRNYSENRATWLYIDEMHVLLNNASAQEYLLSLWKKVRSFGGMCTGITQNVGDILRNNTTVALLENSEFVMIFKQNIVAFDKLVTTMGISHEQIKYITSESGSGRGLLKCGQTVVPIDMNIDRVKHSELYEIIDTNAHEKFERENNG